MYCDEARALAESYRVDVIVLARPIGLKDVAMPPRGRRKVGEDADDDVAADVAMRFADFQDLVKARLLCIKLPVQMVRRSTFDESISPPTGSRRQDEATRAWNFHVATSTTSPRECRGVCSARAVT